MRRKLRIRKFEEFHGGIGALNIIFDTKGAFSSDSLGTKKARF